MNNTGKWFAIWLGASLINWIVAEIWWIGIHWMQYLNRFGMISFPSRMISLKLSVKQWHQNTRILPGSKMI